MTLQTSKIMDLKQDVKAKLFISYSRKDLSFTDKLEAALRARGFDVLVDRSEIYAFEDWWKRVEALIAEADTLIFVLSPDALSSAVCKREVDFASSLNKRLAPVMAVRWIPTLSRTRCRGYSLCVSMIKRPLIQGLITSPKRCQQI
jgi:hypothetical protein